MSLSSNVKSSPTQGISKHGDPINPARSKALPGDPPLENNDGTFTNVNVCNSALTKHIEDNNTAIPVKHLSDEKKTKEGFRLNYLEFLDMHYKYLGTGQQPPLYPPSDIYQLLDDAKQSFIKQNTLVDVRSDIFVVGDIHGQYNDLINIFLTLGHPSTKRYLFLGDYVDRGTMSLQCICLLFAYKIYYPTHVYLLRGNHECARVNKVYGFYDECKRNYNKEGKRIWRYFQRVFDLMPVFGLVDNKVLCMHGGLSPSFVSLDQLRHIPKPISNTTVGLINDALWSDPDHTIKGWQPSTRQTAFAFGADVVKNTCKRLGLELICRAHQVCLDGYCFFADKWLVTIFSAPNYCGQMANAGAVMHISKEHVCKFHLFGPWEKGDKDFERIINQHLGNSTKPVSCDEIPSK